MKKKRASELEFFEPGPSAPAIRGTTHAGRFTLGRLAVLTASLACTLSPVVCSSLPLQSTNDPGQAASRETSLAFVIRFKDGQTKFRQGEIITLELGYGADPKAAASRLAIHYDRPGLAVDEFQLEPRAGVVDPLRDFLASVNLWTGIGPRPAPFIEARGSWMAVDINEWFRFDKTGRYRLSVLGHLVSTGYGASGNRPPGTATLTSNSLELQIIPADPSWQAATVQKAVALLGTNGQQASRILRFMTARPAVDLIIQHYADQSTWEYEFGLFAFPDRDYVVRKMEEGIRDPGTAVSAGYLQTLGTLSAYLERPELAPRGEDPNLGKTSWGIGGPMQLIEQMQQDEKQYVEELIDALGDKTGRARVLSLKALFDSPYLGQPTLLKSANPALLAHLRRELAEVFADLSPSDQQNLLEFRWENIASPDMVPVLRRLYEHPPQNVYGLQFVGLVLERLYEVAPAEGRALIVNEIKSDHPRFDLRFVRLLPDQEIPELDEPLAENLEASNGQESTIVELISRYATPAIFPRVLAVEGSQVGNMACEPQEAFIAYAFRSDPASGAELLSKALASRKATGCFVTTLSEVERHLTPEIRHDVATQVVPYLDDPNLEVASDAAGTLGRYGSAEAEQPLWDRLRKWHSAWAGRASELPAGYGSALKNGLETQLEMMLTQALATGQAWFAGPDKLNRLASLCVSAGGCQQVKQMFAQCADPPVITVFPQSEGQRSAMVNQYHLDSLDSLKQKLVQFPPGTAFKWAFEGEAKDGASLLADIRAFLKEHDMTVR